jgi:hypothetical protein
MCNTPDGLWTTGIKKGLAALGLRVFKVCSCVTEASADVHVVTVHLYIAASVQLTTPRHGYRGDTTRQDDTIVWTMFSTAEL